MRFLRVLTIVFLPGLLCLWVVSGCGPDTSRRQQKMAVRHIRGGLYLVQGGTGANTAFYVAETNVTVIDAKMTPASARRMLALVKKTSDKPITTVVITHSDRDHVNGLPGFPTGLTIVAHSNARNEMLASFSNHQQYLPNRLITGNTVLSPAIRLDYYGPAHTDGDLVVVFPREKAAFIGDLVFIGRDPLIHSHKHGSSFGLVKVLREILKLDVDTLLSGHAPPVGKREVRALIAKIEEKQRQVRDLRQQGKSLPEIRKRLGDELGGKRRWPSLVQTIYRELQEGK